MRESWWSFRRASYLAALVLLTPVLGACGSSSPTSASTPSSVSASRSASSTPADTPLDTAAPADAPIDTAAPADAPTETPSSPEERDSASPDDGSTPSPTASPTPNIDPSTGARTLSLIDFFSPDEAWTASRFEMPKLGEVNGVGAEVSGCSAEYGRSLEFRADGEYDRISLTAGPGRATQDSSHVMVVALYDNDEFLTSTKVKYGMVDSSIKDFKISGVSALKIFVWLDQSDNSCRSGSMQAVLYDIKVS